MTNNYHLLKQQPDSSPEDTRQYQVAQLESGLTLLAVHVPHIKQSAAAMAVQAGHFQDPDNTPGLAHFLEHMLFLGSQKFPEAQGYTQTMTELGGHHNAWTGTEHSNFYFELPAEHFEQGLQRFSDMLIAPLFDPQWVEKERHAIDAEYRMRINDELRRLYDVQKETCNPLHPFSKFSVGSLKTLSDSEDQTLQEKLNFFFQTYYHAKNMALTLVGPQPTQTLLALAAQYFSKIPNRGERTQPVQVPLYLPEQLGQWLYIQPIKEAKRLIITFALPEINSDYLNKTTSYLAHLIGYEGPNSLYSYLFAQGWVTGLSAGGGASGSNFKDFHINIQLTELGLHNHKKIIQACFTFIQLIKKEGLQNQLYLERKKMVELAFLYPETLRPSDLASQLSINALHYQPEHIISGDYRMDALNHHFAHQLLAAMQPTNCRISLIHRNLPTKKQSTWYLAPYDIFKIEAADICQFLSSEPFISADGHAVFSVPQPNLYIPQRVSPQPIEQKAALRKDLMQDTPSYTRISQSFDFWHLQDPIFRVPKAHIYLFFKLPFAHSSAKNLACARIWCELALEQLNERFYDAELAGMHFNLYPQQGGITLHVAGFSCQQPALLKALVTALSHLDIGPDLFTEIAEQLSHNWLEVHKKSPVNHLFDLLHHHLQQGSYTAKQMAESIEDLDFLHFKNLLPGLFKDAHATLLVHGDWTYQQAKDLGSFAAQTLPLTPQPQVESSRYVKRLNKGLKQAPFKSSHPDTATAYFIQGEHTSLSEKVFFLLLNHLMSPQFFNELRTKQQLGYLVGTSYVPMYGLPGILLYIQSPHADTDTLSQAIEAFLQGFLKYASQLPNKEWQAAKQAIQFHLATKAPSLRVRSQRFWQTITLNKADFHLAENLMTCLHKTDLSFFIERLNFHLKDQQSAMKLYTLPLTD